MLVIIVHYLFRSETDWSFKHYHRPTLYHYYQSVILSVCLCQPVSQSVSASIAASFSNVLRAFFSSFKAKFVF
jgi:hypothetical protein